MDSTAFVQQDILGSTVKVITKNHCYNCYNDLTLHGNEFFHALYIHINGFKYIKMSNLFFYVNVTVRPKISGSESFTRWLVSLRVLLPLSLLVLFPLAPCLTPCLTPCLAAVLLRSCSLSCSLSHSLSRVLSHPCLTPCLSPCLAPMSPPVLTPVSPLSHSLSHPCLTPCLAPCLALLAPCPRYHFILGLNVPTSILDFKVPTTMSGMARERARWSEMKLHLVLGSPLPAARKSLIITYCG